MSDETTLNEQNNGEAPEGTIVHEKGLGYTLTVERDNLFKAASGLKEAGFDLLLFVAGVDYPESIKLVYRLYSTKRQNKVAVMIKTEVPKSDPVVDSLVPLWSAANWHERETYDLFGVEFRGHPDLRRIFMPENWVGHPLRKDYTDDHMIVMDDGSSKKEKPAAKDKGEGAEATKPKAEAATKPQKTGSVEPAAEKASAPGTPPETTGAAEPAEPAVSENSEEKSADS